MKSNNTIAAYHILGSEKGALKLNTNKMYHWNIPKRLREDPIHQGYIVLVLTRRGKRPVLVMDVFREDYEEKKKEYKKIVKLIEKSPKL